MTNFLIGMYFAFGLVAFGFTLFGCILGGREGELWRPFAALFLWPILIIVALFRR